MASQYWTQVDLHRQQFLAANGGRAFSPTFIPTTALAYLRPDGLRLTDVFPFITMPAHPPRAVGGVVMDMLYRTSSAPASMPLVFALGVWGAIAAFRPQPSARTAILRIALLAGAAGTVGVFVWGYVSNRYLADFLPVLFVAAAVGMADIWRRLSRRPARTRSAWTALIAALAILSVIINFGIASTPADAGAWQGTKVQAYVKNQEDLSRAMGNPIAANVVQGTRLPAGAPADTLFVLGNCAGLFLSNGESYNPWIPVSCGAPLRHDFAVIFTRSPRALQRIALVTMGRDVVSTVYLEYQGSRMRVAFDDPLFGTDSAWTPITRGKTYRIDVVADVPRQSVAVDFDGGQVMQSLISSGETQTRGLVPPPAYRTLAGPLLLSVQPVKPSPLCTALQSLRQSSAVAATSSAGQAAP